MTNYDDRLPGVKYAPELDPWRITPNDKTVIYDFKSFIRPESEQAAIAIIAAQHRKQSITCARQLRSNRFKSCETRIAIEVQFSTDKARTKAIRQPITYTRQRLYPVTTCTAISLYTLLSFTHINLASSVNELDNNFREMTKRVLSPSECGEVPVTEEDIDEIWLQKDKFGFYNGSGTVILKGFDYKVVKLNDNTTWNDCESAPDYPPVKVRIRKCYMYCNKCRSVNEHRTNDCLYHVIT